MPPLCTNDGPGLGLFVLVIVTIMVVSFIVVACYAKQNGFVLNNQMLNQNNGIQMSNTGVNQYPVVNLGPYPGYGYSPNFVPGQDQPIYALGQGPPMYVPRLGPNVYVSGQGRPMFVPGQGPPMYVAGQRPLMYYPGQPLPSYFPEQIPPMYATGQQPLTYKNPEIPIIINSSTNHNEINNSEITNINILPEPQHEENQPHPEKKFSEKVDDIDE